MDVGCAKCTCGVLGQLVGVLVPAYFSPLWGGVGTISLLSFFYLALAKGRLWRCVIKSRNVLLCC